MGGIAGYSRLSQDDADKHSATIEERMSLRIGYLSHVAKNYGVELKVEDVAFDVMTGASLIERINLLNLLKRCDIGDIHTLVIFDIDRFTRDLGDWTTIKRSLFKGKIRLLTARGEYHFTRGYDSTLLDILAVFGEGERRKFSFRAKAANDQRARKGQLSGGRAPYGYSWDKASKTFSIVDHEYPIVEEIFEKLETVGAYTVARYLNNRGIPAPGRGDIPRASSRWLATTIRWMGGNPFYAGFPCKRSETDRDGNPIPLPREEWIWSEEEQSYPHPINLDKWEELQCMISARYHGFGGSIGLLTGRLKCSQGFPMSRSSKHYICSCKIHRTSHSGGRIRREALENTVINAVNAVWDATDPSLFQATPRKTAATGHSIQLTALLRQQRDTQASFHRLLSDASFLDSLKSYGEEQRKKDMADMDAKLLQLAADIADLRSETMIEPFVLPSELVLFIQKLGGLKSYFNNAEIEQIEIRNLLQKLIVSIQLAPVPEGRRNTRSLTLTLRPPLQDCPVQIPLIYTQYKKR